MSHPSCPLTRRQFALALSAASFARAAESGQPWNQPADIAKVFVAQPNVHWPKPDLDVAQEMKEVEANLADVARKNQHNVHFTSSTLVRTAEDCARWRASLGNADGVLIIPLGGGSIPQVIEGLDKPALVFSRPYASHSWSGIAGLRKSGRKIDVIATSSYGDLDPLPPHVPHRPPPQGQ